jgi:hypothetical protein
MEANPPGHARTLRMPFIEGGVCRVPRVLTVGEELSR